jgi:hypothetical protein
MIFRVIAELEDDSEVKAFNSLQDDREKNKQW